MACLIGILIFWIGINIVLPIVLSKSNRANPDRCSSKMMDMKDLDNYVDEWRDVLGEDFISYKERNVK